MKRDIDLVLKILRSVEAREDVGGVVPVEVDGYTAEQIGFHVKLLVDGGCLEGEDHGGDGEMGYSSYYPRCLTNEGYNFLEVANKATKDEDDRYWNKFKAVVAEKGLSVSVEFLTKAALGL